MARNSAAVDTAEEGERERERERGKMSLLMESAPREHEKRTLSAHLECTGCVYMCERSYSNPCEKQTSSHFVCGTSHFKKEAILGLTVRAGITGKAGTSCGF